MSERFWTDEALKMLRQHHGAGLTYAQIATELGTSRNAVAGQAFRLGLAQPKTRGKRVRGARKGILAQQYASAEATKLSWADPEKRAKRLESMAQRRGGRRKPVAGITLAGGITMLPESVEAAVSAAERDIAEIVATTSPHAGAVTIMALRPFDCRWIDGEINGAETLYCGQRCASGQRWRPEHAARAFSGRAA